MLWSMFFAVSRDASWPQKFGLDVQPAGATIASENGTTVAYVETSPTSILLFGTDLSRGADANPALGQFTSGADPARFAEAVLICQSTLLSNLGINPADVEQTRASQSGVAIQLKRSAQRKTAMAYVPMFRVADEELLGLISKCHNIFYPTAPVLSEEGWRINYILPEMSLDEREALISQEIELIKLGLSSRVDLVMKVRPEVKSRKEALESLLEKMEEEALLNAGLGITKVEDKSLTKEEEGVENERE